MLFNICLATFFLFLYKRGGRSSDKVILIIMIMMALLRNISVGTDNRGYISDLMNGYFTTTWTDITNLFSSGGFKIITEGDYSQREVFFCLIFQALNALLNNPFGAMNCIICIVTWLYYRSFRIYNNGENVSLCLFLYFCTFLYYEPYNTLRQGLAESFVLLGCIFLFTMPKPQKLLGLIPLLLACLTHNSSLYAIPLLLILYFIKIPIKFQVASLILMLIGDFFNVGQLDLFQYANTTLIPYEHMSASYSDNVALIYNPYVHYLGFIFHSYIVFYYVWLQKHIIKMEKGITNIWYFGILSYILLIGAPNVARITEYFYMFQLLIIPCLFNNIGDLDEPTKKRLKLFTFVFAFGWLIFYTQSTWYGVVPYKTILFH